MNALGKIGHRIGLVFCDSINLNTSEFEVQLRNLVIDDKNGFVLNSHGALQTQQGI